MQQHAVACMQAGAGTGKEQEPGWQRQKDDYSTTQLRGADSDAQSLGCRMHKMDDLAFSVGFRNSALWVSCSGKRA